MTKKEEKEQEESIEEIEGQEAETVEDDLMAELRQRLEDARQEAGENLDGWQRAQAEFINYKKRIEREQAALYDDATARVVKRFLPVVDDLDRALQNQPRGGESAEWAAGIDLIYRKLITILDNEGVKPMKTVGEMFDPNLHEAISQEDSDDHESGQIIEEIQKGYLIGERVLRAALVRVAS